MKKFVCGMLAATISGQAIGASCAQPVYHLLQGQPAVCEGYLFSPDEEAKLRLEDQDYKLLKDESDLKDKQLQLYKGEVDDLQIAVTKEKDETKMWRDTADAAEQKYISQEERAGGRDLLFTVLGVLLTIGSGYAISKASHAAGAIHK
jgi:hypothetical protein